MSSIAQINVVYLDVEDRLLLRIATSGKEEFQLLLTRRLALGLLNVDAKVSRPMANSPARPEVVAFERDHALASLNFAETYNAQPRVKVLGEQPLLMVEVRLTVGKAYALTAELVDGRRISLDLSAQLYHGLIQLVRKAGEHAAWGLSSVVASPEPVSGTVAQRGVVH